MWKYIGLSLFILKRNSTIEGMVTFQDRGNRSKDNRKLNRLTSMKEFQQRGMLFLVFVYIHFLLSEYTIIGTTVSTA